MGNKPTTVARKFRQLEKRLVDDVADEAENFLQGVQVNASINVNENGSEASGELLELLRAQDPTRVETDDGYELSISLPPEYNYLEYGTGERGGLTDGARGGQKYFEAPDQPPINAIKEWIKTKGVEPRYRDLSDHQLAYAIATKITQVGTKAHPFLRPAFYEQLERDPTYEDAIGDTLDDIF